MNDPRYDKLAKLLIEHSCELKKGEAIFIDLSDVPDGMGVSLLRAARKVGGLPLIEMRRSRIVREVLRGTNKTHASKLRDVELHRMKKVHAYIAIRGAENTNELSDVSSKSMQLYSKMMRPLLNYRVNKTKWVVLRWPNPSMAQSADMSTEAFEDFYFDVCTFDYRKLQKAMKPLARRMTMAKQVHIKGPGTDLEFSIAGMSAIPCGGDRNIPDGEVFSCPTKKSCNGVIQFNTPSLYAGTKFENVKLELEDGKVVNAIGNKIKKLNEILNTDPGARYIGEFSLGLNPFIEDPMCDILFDEKITGSLHFTPGQAYEECDNGNRSAVHWDMVLIQRKSWGGGEVWFDGELIRKDGLFVVKDLLPLNPKNLKK